MIKETAVVRVTSLDNAKMITFNNKNKIEAERYLMITHETKLVMKLDESKYKVLRSHH